MNVGLPGTGLGGLFYLLSAVFMAVRELFLWLLRRGDQKVLLVSLQQAGISLSMLLAIYGTFWIVYQFDRLFTRVGVSSVISNNFHLSGHVKPIFLTIAILFLLLSTVWLLGARLVAVNKLNKS